MLNMTARETLPPASGYQALHAFGDQSASVMADLPGAMWSAAHDAGLSALMDIVAPLCAGLLGLTPLRDPGRPQPTATADARRWRDMPDLANHNRVALAFAEQYTVDVSSITEADRAALVDVLGTDLRAFIECIWVADFVPRTRAALDQLFGDGAWPERSVAADPGDLRRQLVRFVPRLRGLDDVTTELVRLRGARQHNCRKCKSLRSKAALRGGADEATFDSIDDYPSSSFTPRQKAALAMTDAMIWAPGVADHEVIGELQMLWSPAEQVELVLDIARNASNKVPVALGTDEASITEGFEVYEILPDGEIVFS